MSGDWDFYSCHVDDKPASIFVDLDLEHEAPMSHLPYAAYVKLRMNAPRPDGFSSNEEFETLNTIEDALVASLTETSTTLYVGRLTSAGRREFFFYASDVSDWRERVSEFAAMHPGYAFDSGSCEDPDWRCYLEFLRPSPVDRQRIENRRVCFLLEKDGDSLTQAREIDHTACFPTQEARSAFVQCVAERGYRLKQVVDADQSAGVYRAEICRVDLPNLQTIDDITLPLHQLAKELGGTYDGWGTLVIREEKA
jgi:uncharacterized protein (TIGR01619 family)